MSVRKCCDCGEILAEGPNVKAENQEDDFVEEDARKWENFLCLRCKTNLESLVDSKDMIHQSINNTHQLTDEPNSIFIKEEEIVYEEKIEAVSLRSHETEAESKSLIEMEDEEKKIHIRNQSKKQPSKTYFLDKKKWNQEDMKMAIQNCRMGNMGYLQASKIFNVPKSTLVRYVHSDKNLSEVLDVKIGRKPIFSQELENNLAARCIEMERRFFGLTRTDVRRLAFHLCKINCIKNTYFPKNEMAGRKWLNQFLMRNKHLSMTKLDARHLTRENVQQFFAIYEPEFTKVAGNPLRIYNCDEIGVTNLQQCTPKVISLRGKKAPQESAEKGNTVTITVCMNAIGNTIPPSLIYPRVNMKKQLMNGAPPGSIYACNKTGWQTNETFLEWFEHFVRHAKPSQNDPVILILDGLYFHTRNPELIDCALDNHVIIISIPPHSSNKMLPLDVAVMWPLREFYTKEIASWNDTRPVGTQPLGEQFARAYYHAATLANAESGFRATGIYPLNPNIFTPNDFVQCEENGLEARKTRQNNRDINHKNLHNEDSVDNINGHQDVKNVREMLSIQNNHVGPLLESYCTSNEDIDMDEPLEVTEYPSQNCEVMLLESSITSNYDNHMEDPLGSMNDSDNILPEKRSRSK